MQKCPREFGGRFRSHCYCVYQEIVYYAFTDSPNSATALELLLSAALLVAVYSPAAGSQQAAWALGAALQEDDLLRATAPRSGRYLQEHLQSLALVSLLPSQQKRSVRPPRSSAVCLC